MFQYNQIKLKLKQFSNVLKGDVSHVISFWCSDPNAPGGMPVMQQSEQVRIFASFSYLVAWYI